MANWYEDLRHAVEVEPIGELYLRTLVLRLKFELGTAIAVIAAALGTLGVVEIQISSHVWLFLSLSGLAAYLLYEARGTCGTLDKVREELVKGIIKK
jgi:hypothetical protein